MKRKRFVMWINQVKAYDQGNVGQPIHKIPYKQGRNSTRWVFVSSCIQADRA